VPEQARERAGRLGGEPHHLVGGLRLIGAGLECLSGERERLAGIGAPRGAVLPERANHQSRLCSGEPGDAPLRLVESRACTQQLETPVDLVADGDRKLQHGGCARPARRPCDRSRQILQRVDLVRRQLVDRNARPLQLGRDRARRAGDGTGNEVPALVVDDAQDRDLGAGAPGSRLGDRPERVGNAPSGRDAHPRLGERLERLPGPLQRGTGLALPVT